MFRPLAPGAYNVTAVMAGYLNKTMTVAVPADGSGETVELFIERAGLDVLTNWNLSRKFGPLREGTHGPVRPPLLLCGCSLSLPSMSVKR